MKIASLFSRRRPQTGEAEARKARSMAQLTAEAVPCHEFLPVIDTEATATRRSEKEVADRALGAMIAAIKGETRDNDLIAKVIAQYRAEDCFTPEERSFLDAETPDDADCVKFAWRYEGVHVLLWALGFYPAMPYPADIVHAAEIAQLFRRLGREGVEAQAKLRPQSEILDAADLIYRYNWACVNARANGQIPPSNLDSGVVYERHYALNWLIGYLDQGWDEITTDT